MSLLCFVKFSEGDDVWVVENLKNLGLLKSFFFLTFAHVGNIDLLNDAEVAITFTFYEVCFAESSFTQKLLLLVDFKEGLCLLSCSSGYLKVVCAFHR